LDTLDPLMSIHGFFFCFVGWIPFWKRENSTRDSGKVILYHLSFLSWGRKFSLGSSLEKKTGVTFMVSNFKAQSSHFSSPFCGRSHDLLQNQKFRSFLHQKLSDSYSSWSGQKVNFDKSAIFFSNTRLSLQASIYSSLNLCQRTTKSRYLGIPLF
jgi:hypothetical protein